MRAIDIDSDFGPRETRPLLWAIILPLNAHVPVTLIVIFDFILVSKIRDSAPVAEQQQYRDGIRRSSHGSDDCSSKTKVLPSITCS